MTEFPSDSNKSRSGDRVEASGIYPYSPTQVVKTPATEEVSPSGFIIYGTLVFIQILFGANFVSSKYVLGFLPPFTFASIRWIISGLTLLAYVLIKGIKSGHEKSKTVWLQIIFLSVLGISLSQSLFMIGLNKTTSTNTSVICTTIPIFTLIFCGLRRLVKIDLFKISGFLISFIGVGILKKVEDFNIQNQTLFGDFLILLSCISMGAFITYSKDLFVKCNPVWASAYLFTIGGLFLIPFSFDEVKSIPHIPYDAMFYISICYSIFGATLLAYFLNNWILVYANPDRVGLFINLQPVVAIAVAWACLSEALTLRTFFSIALIILGMNIALAGGKSRLKN
jgi:drug/metabolite transporter (DMT)-like permease